MRRINFSFVVLWALVLCVLVYFSGQRFLGRNDRGFGEWQNRQALEKLAAQRLGRRGLTPCTVDDRRFVGSMLSKAHELGHSIPAAVLLAAPSFADVQMTILESQRAETYRFEGQTAFSGMAEDWFRRAPKKVASVELSMGNYLQVNSAISRNTKYAMTAMEGGLDGDNYYFAVGENICAKTWSPEAGSPAGLIVQLLLEVSGESPSSSKIGAILHLLEEVERAR